MAIFITWQLHPRETAGQRLLQECDIYFAKTLNPVGSASSMGEAHGLRRECESWARQAVDRRRECVTIVLEAQANLGIDLAVEDLAANCIGDRPVWSATSLLVRVPK